MYPSLTSIDADLSLINVFDVGDLGLKLHLIAEDLQILRCLSLIAQYGRVAHRHAEHIGQHLRQPVLANEVSR